MIAAEGILTSRGRPRQPRRRRRPGLGQARRRRRRHGPRSAAGAFTRRRRDASPRATSSPSTAPPARSSLGEVAAQPRRAAGRVRDHPQVGRRDPQGPAGRAGQRRQRPRRRQRPPVRRRGHRPVPHRAHVPRRGPAADRAAHDPRRHRRRRRRAALEELRVAQKAGLRRHPRGHGRPARSPCGCSTRRCTSSCRRPRSWRQEGDGRPRRTEERAARRPPRTGRRSTRCSAPAACASASSSPGSTPCRCGP